MKRKRELVASLTFIIKPLLALSRILPNEFYLRLLKLIRHHDNYLAMFTRFVCLKNCAKSCGNNIAVFSGVFLYNIHNLEIGSNVSIHPLCYIDAAGEIKIGNDVSIAHGTTILSEEHVFSDLHSNIKDQGRELKKTVVENNVWVGSGCRILGGSHIKSGGIIAAGAVVKGEIERNTVVGGIPAKLIKERH